MNIFIFLLLQTPAPTATAEMRVLDGSGVWESVRNLLWEAVAILPYLAVGIVVFILFRLVARFAGQIVKSLVVRMRLDENLALLLGGFTSLTLTFIGVVAAVLVIFRGFNPLDVLAAVGTVIVLSPEGKERRRTEGYLPKEEFHPQLEMGRARVALMRKRWF